MHTTWVPSLESICRTPDMRRRLCLRVILSRVSRNRSLGSIDLLCRGKGRRSRRWAHFVAEGPPVFLYHHLFESPDRRSRRHLLTKGLAARLISHSDGQSQADSRGSGVDFAVECPRQGHLRCEVSYWRENRKLRHYLVAPLTSSSPSRACHLGFCNALCLDGSL